MNKSNWQNLSAIILFQHNKPMIGKSNIQKQLLESGDGGNLQACGMQMDPWGLKESICKYLRRNVSVKGQRMWLHFQRENSQKTIKKGGTAG